ncbi:putative cytomegalovirus gh-receptor family [Phaeomoniella chlamydospora]|uniref:Putative cytomegalovirus gh-receptor family n=1 Tax=Phaeomoniella chlamydospora TaxID=158046 RepID=A0A0G2HFH9_PHACM|nr:putative cytomegalovirus gh-receptor family [Phaeomoniella chlamydospora]
MTELHFPHAFADHDPTGRELPTWPQRRPSQVPIHDEDITPSSNPKGEMGHFLGKKPINGQSAPGVLALADPNTLADGSLRNTSTSGEETGQETRSQGVLNDDPSSRASKAGLSTNQDGEKEKVLKLSPAQIQELTSSPDSLPVRIVPEAPSPILGASATNSTSLPAPKTVSEEGDSKDQSKRPVAPAPSGPSSIAGLPLLMSDISTQLASPATVARPSSLNRAVSTPTSIRMKQSRDDLSARSSKPPRHAPPPLKFAMPSDKESLAPSTLPDALPSPMPPTIPLPPLSLPTYLQLELASTRPSPLYIHRSVTSDFPYESSRVKLERLQNFLYLPPQLESVLWFGTFACLDAWLYTFTILPLRFFKAVSILVQSWFKNITTEVQFVSSFVYQGSGRMWQRRRTRGSSVSEVSKDPFVDDNNLNKSPLAAKEDRKRPGLAERPSEASRIPRISRKHKRTKSVPSALLPDDKADILKGLLIIATCAVLMRLNASRVYHWIRQQAAIKLYVIYNVLEVGDRLFSALGQDVLECLFSREALERRPDGRSKVMRPFSLFVLALVYCVIHSTALFYQVITLNVAVNSYSNALITLLMSNQFVEIKGTVFKKFEKENLFQLTCADVVERFQLWLMLVIIASRNIVETGGLSTGFSLFASSSSSPNSAPSTTNTSEAFSPPRSSASILPSAFELLPNLFSSVTAYAPSVGHVLAPFLVVLGSEMLVDWLKHAYITKFNNTRPAIYGRFLDVLAKDYYSNAFADQNLTKRLGLPVIPLSCLFIRAGVQTYHMFLAAWVPAPLPSSATSLASLTTASMTQPTSTTAAISQQIDAFLRQIPISISSSRAFRNMTTVLVCVLIYAVLLALKLVLGMVLLNFSRSRYRTMKQREKNPIHHVEGGRRVGGWGVVEVDEDKKRWIYEDDPAGAKASKDREAKEKERRDKELGFEKVKRYEMAAKRIW